MIVKEIIPRRYGSLFLATEADDEPQQRKNVKVVSVGKRKDRRTDFNDIGAEPISADTTAEDTDSNFDDIGTEEEPTETTDDATETTDAGTDATTNTDAPEPATDTANTGEAETTTDDSGTQTITAASGEEETTDDDTSFDDIGDDGTGGTEDTTQQTQQDDNNQPKGPGLEYDSTRKYMLFKEYMSLYNSVNNYVSKLENIMNDDPVSNHIIKVSVNNLREIRDLTFDFITLKYQTSSYIQSLLFYQKMVASVQLVFNMLNKINKIDEKHKNKK